MRDPNRGERMEEVARTAFAMATRRCVVVVQRPLPLPSDQRQRRAIARNARSRRARMRLPHRPVQTGERHAQKLERRRRDEST